MCAPTARCNIVLFMNKIVLERGQIKTANLISCLNTSSKKKYQEEYNANWFYDLLNISFVKGTKNISDNMLINL